MNMTKGSIALFISGNNGCFSLIILKTEFLLLRSLSDYWPASSLLGPSPLCALPEGSGNGFQNISVATHRAIQLVSRIYMFGFLPIGWNRCSNLSWTLNVFFFIASFSFSLWWRHSVHLYCRAWQSEHGAGLDFSLQGTGTCFVTFADM